MPDQAYVQIWDNTPPPFESVTAMNTWTCTIAEEQPEGVRCGAVEQSFLRVLGVPVALGRDFAPGDDIRGAPRVALISHGLWVRRYGMDPGVLARTVSLDTPMGPMPGIPIVGVLPPDFDMPLGAAEILLPSQLRPIDTNQPFATQIMALARLRPDVTPERAEQMLAPQLSQIPTPPGLSAEWQVRPLHDRRVGDAGRVAWLLIGAVGAFLSIACVNVTNLMLARVAERQREFAVRAALGAGKPRLARLALAEGLLLSLTAGGIGLLVAFALLKTFVAMAPPGGAVAQSVAAASIDARVFVAAGLLVVLTGMAIGGWPAVSVFRAGGVHGLRAASPASPGARPRARFALVTAQVALTLALLGGSALLLRTLWNVVNVPLGFDAGRVITLTTGLSFSRYPTAEHMAAFFDELLARARTTPGAASAALSDSAPPPLPPNGRAPLTVEWRVVDPGVTQPMIGLRRVSPRYFETFRIPLASGRTFQDADRTGEPVVVLNESAARLLFAGEPALGRRVQPPALGFSNGAFVPSPWYTVIGVSADVRNGRSLTDAPAPEMYLLAPSGTGWPAGYLSLRTTASAEDAAAYLRQIAADLDPKQLVAIQTSGELMTLLTAQPRFIAWLLSAFAALALLLAAAGLYSVASYLVSQRRRDIGVRIALGAGPGDVGRTVVGEAGRWIVGGAVLGCALGWMGTRALQSQLYEVGALDPWSWAGALLALALALAVAVVRPAYRAAHVDPIGALRAE
jgi:putative ABC transport system permease protein